MNSIETSEPKVNQIEHDLFFKLISKKYTFTILNELRYYKNRRFTNLIRNIDNISSKTMTSRLKDLVEHGLISRKQFNEIPPRVEYSITPRGIDVVEKINSLINFNTNDFSYSEYNQD